MSSDKRKWIHAYKNGVAPSHVPPRLCVGRHHEVEAIRAGLAATKTGSGSVRWICGAYGTGKTFLLNVLRDVALEEDFVVATLRVDRSFRLNNLEQLYYQIMHNLHVKTVQDRKCSFDDLFNIWIENLQNSPMKSQASAEISKVINELNHYHNAFSRAFLSYIRARIGEDRSASDVIGAWLSGEKNIPAHVKKQFDMIGQVDRVNMLDFMRAFSRLVVLLGYSGLAIFVDEMDVMLTERKDIRMSGYTNIRELIDMTATGELENTFFVMSATPDVLTDEERGFPTYQALSQRLGQAMDPGRSSMGDLKQPVLHLKPLGIDAFGDFTHAFVEEYRQAFPLQLRITPESLKNWVLLTYHKEGVDLTTLTIRSFSTKLLEILDIIQQNPDNNIFRSELYAYPGPGGMVFKSKPIASS